MITSEQLQAAGLKVRRSAQAHDHSVCYIIRLPKSLRSRVPDPSPVYATAPAITLADIPCSVYQHAGEWMVEVWERVPGPDEGDFRVAFPARSQAFLAAHDFFLGAPTLIAGWRVPLHRHPEVLHVPLEHVIGEAVNITASDFTRIREQRIQQMYGSFAPMILTQGKTRWEKAVQAQFLQIAHQTRDDMLLYLRRDAQEAYIVHIP